MPHLVNNGVSISIICCLYVYCQTGNIATHENLRFPQDTAEGKVKTKLVDSYDAMRFFGHKGKIIECSFRQAIKPGVLSVYLYIAKFVLLPFTNTILPSVGRSKK